MRKYSIFCSLPNFFRTFWFVLLLFPIFILAYLMITNWERDWGYDYSRIDPQLADTVRQLAEGVQVIAAQPLDANSGRKPQRWHTQRWLMDTASTEDLLTLTYFPNAVIKATAFEGLFKRNYPGLFPIILRYASEEPEWLGVSNRGYHPGFYTLNEYCLTEVLRCKLPGSPPLPPGLDYPCSLTREQLILLSRAMNRSADQKPRF